MKFIIENKVYDTEKSQTVCSYYENKKVQYAIFECLLRTKYTIYKTEKGNYFTATNEENVKTSERAKVIKEETVKLVLLKLNEVEQFQKLFGELEEA